MRAYFTYYAPKTHAHKPMATALVPVNGLYIAYTLVLPDVENHATWKNFGDSGWKVQTPPTLEDAQRFLAATIPAGAVPTREWAIEVPEKIYEDPLAKRPVTDVRAPVNKWFEGVLKEVNGTDPYTGTVIGAMLSAEAEEYLRNRVKHMANDALAAIVLRTNSGPRQAKPKTSTLTGKQTYTRPNGETYYARKWGEHTDVEVLKKARELGVNVYLSSVPGTGKTAAVEAAFGTDLYTVVGSARTEASDLLGGWIDKGDGTHVWLDGPAVKAAEEGKPLYIDEVGLIDSKELSPLYPLMDGRGELTIDANPARGTIKAKKGFIVIGTTNPKAPGVRMSEALLSRFDLQAVMTTDYKVLEHQIGVNPALCRISENLARKQKEEEVSWAPQFRELLAFHRLEKEFGTQFALANMLASVPEHDMEEVSQALIGALGENVKAAEIV